MFAAAMGANFFLLFSRCITWDQAWSAVNMGVTITVGASFALGQALDATGAAKAIAFTLMRVCSKMGGIGLLFGLYLTTAMLSALLSNNATVALVTPIAYEFVLAGLLPLKAVAYTLMFAAAADFSTPIGYQTNLMVRVALTSREGCIN
jgi:di/tricarboxylate transporter